MTVRRPRNSLRTRRECFEKHRWTDPVTGRTMLTCHICGEPINPMRDKWDAEHVIRRVLKESDSPDDVKPAHSKGCHKEKTRVDNRETAKGKRVSDFHYGIKQPRSIIPGSKRSKFKKHMDGSVSRR